MEEFVSVIKKRDANLIFVSILACSDNDAEIGYLNQLDKSVPHLDVRFSFVFAVFLICFFSKVLDDFRSEKKEVSRKNADFGEAYTLGDHVARYFLGSIFAKYDAIDGF